MTKIILDDGEFLIDMNESESVDIAIDGLSTAAPGAGFLHHRCPLDPLANRGFERIGEYSSRDGKWTASINTKHYLNKAGYLPNVGLFENRMDAITSLWKARRDAWLLHI